MKSRGASKIAAVVALVLYALCGALAVASFVMEYNLAQAILGLFVGTVTLGLAVVATLVAILVRSGDPAGRASR